MTSAARWKTLLCFILVMAAQWSAEAAEVRLRESCLLYGTLVRLSDIAEVVDPDPSTVAMLSAIELMPAPAAGQTRMLTARQVQELLALHTTDTAAVRVTGAGAVEMKTGGQRRTAMPPAFTESAQSVAAPATKLTRDGAVKALEQAIVSYLTQHSDASAGWEVRIDLAVLDVAAFAVPGNWKVTGGQHPWNGVQTFIVTTEPSAALPATGPRRHVIKAQVTRVPMVVVATRAIERGERISRADVELQPSSNAQANTGMSRLEDVIGKETVRPIAAGRVVDDSSVRTPILVQAREIVTVIARTGGVVVHTQGRAMSAGSVGDVIMVESLFDLDVRGRSRTTSTFPARIIGKQQVDVYVQGAVVPSTPLETAEIPYDGSGKPSRF